MSALHNHFSLSPEIALFMALGIGYFLGQRKILGFQLGGTCGTLLAAVCISQLGVTVDSGVTSLMLCLFIYTIGYESGPQFFNSFHRKTLREFALAVFFALSALVTILACAKLFGLNKGLAAGLAAGALTQSGIVGTAGDAITRLGLPPDEVRFLQSQVAIGFAVTYIPGLLGAIVGCVNIVPRFMRTSLRDAAHAIEQASGSGPGNHADGRSALVPPLVGRAYKAGQAAGLTVAEIENGLISIERVRRADTFIDIHDNLVLDQEDVILIVGMRDSVLAVAQSLGTEVAEHRDMSAEMHSRQAVFTGEGKHRIRIIEGKATIDGKSRNAVFIQAVTRAGRPLPVFANTELQRGDVITFYGSPENTLRAAEAVGLHLPHSDKTDFVYMSLGLVAGLVVGKFVVYIGGFPLTLGAGSGCLIAGLLFGWLRARRPMYGAMPPAAAQAFKDFGLSAFVAAVGLDSGVQALLTVKESGMTLLLLGVFVTLFPMILSMLFARYILRYRNAALLAGALAGSRGASPAFGQVIDKSESPVATVPFAVTYALGSVLLALLGPVLIELA
ncbi:aspartate-alanine antiporter [Paraburkholderia strydomiana]|uniref:aspartate-alanine antiporter n=1 Tax=Paraburkholderia strydomiana TaxID=1245417 RepID=UPI002863011A|nr:aspartate-alanine antiporter [Paraburkholderia strydomiana]MDR7009964.1 aspartate-alanine antiporter [Paraburkholderia strydomiana]